MGTPTYVYGSQPFNAHQQPMYPPPYMQPLHGMPQGIEQGVNQQAAPVEPQSCVEQRGAVSQLIDLNMIVEV